MTIGGGVAGSASFPGGQIGASEPPYQAERPDMDSDNEADDGGDAQQERAEDPGDEFNARE